MLMEVLGMTREEQTMIATDEYTTTSDASTIAYVAGFLTGRGSFNTDGAKV
jgi:hypothetical protein